MKKKIILFAALLLFCGISFAQTLYRTYYDYQKQHVQEEYYSNSYGVKNGVYKKYSEYGGVILQGTYKDGKKVGKWEVMNNHGKIKIGITYNDDIANGPYAVYYDDGTPAEEGNYIDNYKTGTCYKYDLYTTILNENNDQNIADISKSAITGCQYIKYPVHYEHDKDYSDGSDDGFQHILHDDYGHIVYIFYPSGKKYCEGHYINGNWVGDYCQYFPNGKLEGFLENDTVTGENLFRKVWAWPGGNKDSIAIYKAQLIAQQEAAAKWREQEALEQRKQAEIQQKREDSLAEISRKQAEIQQKRVDSLAEVYHKQAEIQQKREDSLAEISRKQAEIQQKIKMKSDTIDLLYQKFKGLYVGRKQSTLLGVQLVNTQTQQPIYTTTYPNGEYLYMKSDTLIKYMYKDCNNTSDIGSHINKCNDIIILLNKLISYSATDLNGKKLTDTKALDKEMKKAETMDDVKRILGL